MVEFISGGLTFLVFLMIYMSFKESGRDVFSKMDGWSSIDSHKKVNKGRSILTFALAPERLKSILNRAMERASLPLRGEEALLLWIVLSLVGLLIGAFIGPVAMLICGVLGFVLPCLWIRRRIAKRLRRIEKQLPGLLDLLSSGLRAGFSFLQALQNASERTAQPLGGSLQHMVGELSVGLDLETALRRWVDRTGSVDLDLAVTSVLIQREVGGNLATILDGISNLMRDRQESADQMRALTSQGRMEGMVISLLPIILAGVLTLINPHYMSPLFSTLIGRRMLTGSSFMALIGIFMIQKIVKPKY